jgi:predicted DNA-binding protein
MTTKPPAKKSVIKLRPEEFRMPVEVKEWIDQASSRINAMRTEIDRLKELISMMAKQAEDTRKAMK